MNYKLDKRLFANVGENFKEPESLKEVTEKVVDDWCMFTAVLDCLTDVVDNDLSNVYEPYDIYRDIESDFTEIEITIGKKTENGFAKYLTAVIDTPVGYYLDESNTYVFDDLKSNTHLKIRLDDVINLTADTYTTEHHAKNSTSCNETIYSTIYNTHTTAYIFEFHNISNGLDYIVEIYSINKC